MRASHRVVPAAVGALAAMLVIAMPTDAAAPAGGLAVATGRASHITSTTGALRGVVATHGNQATWAFQYGTSSTSYTGGTPVALIPPGRGNVDVSATIRGLRPFTTYHYRLIASTGSGVYYYLTTVRGRDRTFTTAGTGRLVLDGDVLPVSDQHHTLKVTLGCASSQACTGKFSVVIRARIAHSGRFATVVVTDGRTTGFTIGAHKKRTVTVRARGAVVALLRATPAHRLSAKLSSYPRTGQHALIAKVKLRLAT